jgi:adenine deaminase
MAQDPLDLSRIRQALSARRVLWTGHAKRRLRSRRIQRHEVFEVIEKGTILERYPNEKPYPKCLMMGMVRNQQPLYVSLAFDGHHIIIITVHWFDPARWIDPWTRRR